MGEGKQVDISCVVERSGCVGEVGIRNRIWRVRIRIRIGDWRAGTLETREMEQAGEEPQFTYCETRNTLCHVVGRDGFVSGLAFAWCAEPLAGLICGKTHEKYNLSHNIPHFPTITLSTPPLCRVWGLF